MIILTKFPADVRDYDFDFNQQSEIIAGATISITTVVKEVIQGGDTLVVGAATASAGKVQFQLSGGALGDIYRFKCVAILNTGKTITGYGRLYVVDDIP